MIDYSYDAMDQLIQVKDMYGARTYTYDEFGNRIQKTDQEATISYQYNFLNQMIGEDVKQNQEGIQYYQIDNKYSVKALTNKNGETLTKVEYDEFGAIRNPVGSFRVHYLKIQLVVFLLQKLTKLMEKSYSYTTINNLNM